MHKSKVLTTLLEKYQDWEGLLDRIGPTRMEEAGVNGDWSMKDIVAHLTGWNRGLVARLRAAAQSESEPTLPWPEHLEDEDDINAWIYKTNRDRSLTGVLDDMHQVHEQLLAAVEALPEGARFELIEPKFLVVWVGEKRYHLSEFFDHFEDDHRPDVDAWLARAGNQPA